MNEGSLVRINPELFGAVPEFENMYGDLGYVGFMVHYIFRVVKLETDSGRGEIAHCEITNPDVIIGIMPGVKRVECEGTIVLQVKDMIPANMKTTLDYVVSTASSEADKMIEDLMKLRKKMRGQGKDKDHRDMKRNWKQITELRATKSGQVLVTLVKQGLSFKLDRSELPKEETQEAQDAFKQKLAGMLRGVRSKLKVEVNETKDVFGVSVRKRGGVFLEAGSLLKAYEESLKTGLETPKKPTDSKANYVGIEIEFIYRGDYEMLKKLLIKEKLHRFVDLTSDGSLRACYSQNGYSTLEMRVICKSNEVVSVMQRLDKVFNNPKVDAYTNRSCGLHVHLDMRNRDVAKVYKNLVRVQNLLRGSQPIGRITNQHCQANTDDTADFAAKAEGRAGRYWVVNPASYSKHKTLEVRIHEGTTDGQNITDWVAFLEAIANHNEVIPKNNLMLASEVAAAYNISIPANAMKYIDNRVNKFQSLSAG